MRELEERILRDGKVYAGDVLKVDGFLNHQLDPALFRRMGEEWRRRFADQGVNKLLTLEASGIGIAAIAGEVFGCPVLFAKKSRTRNIAGSVYTAQVESYTHGQVYTILCSKEYLLPTDRVLLLDDFLANGNAMMGLLDLCRQAGAAVVGAGVAVEKAYQPGGERLRGQGVRVESLARILAMSPEEGITLAPDPA